MPGLINAQIYGDKVTITLDAKHVYKVKIDGGSPIVVPSATGITGMIDKSGPLTGWAVKQACAYMRSKLVPGQVLDEVSIEVLLKAASRAHRTFMEKAATIGTLTHEWVEAHVKGLLDESNTDPKLPTNPVVRASVNAFLGWEKANKVEYVFSERPLYSIVNNYAGTLDILAIVGNKLSVVDIKTSTGVYPEFFLQLAGYSQALAEEFSEPIEQRIIVHLDKASGEFTPHVCEDEGPGMEADVKAFNHCRGLYFRMKGM